MTFTNRFFIISVSPYQVLLQGGPPPPAMSGNQITSISPTVTSGAGGVTVMQGHVAPAPAASAGTPAVVSGSMMSMSIGTSTSIANSNPYPFPISSHANTTNIQPTQGYPGNAAQTIIYVSWVPFCEM